MLHALKLPDLMLHLTDPGNAQAARVNNAQLAAAVARHAEFGWHGPALEQDVAAVANLLHITQEDAIGRIHRTAVLAARAWHWYGAPPAARWLPLLPEPAAPEPKPQPAAQPFSSMQELMRWAMQALQAEAGLDRVVFALRTPDGQGLRAKFCLGETEPSPFNQFEIGLGNLHLFTRLLQKQQGVWLNQQNEASLQPYLSAELQRVIGRGEFFAHSVYLGPKPFGLFYGDHRGAKLDAAHYQKFKEIVAQVTRAMHRLAGKTP